MICMSENIFLNKILFSVTYVRQHFLSVSCLSDDISLNALLFSTCVDNDDKLPEIIPSSSTSLFLWPQLVCHMLDTALLSPSSWAFTFFPVHLSSLQCKVSLSIFLSMTSSNSLWRMVNQKCIDGANSIWQLRITEKWINNHLGLLIAACDLLTVNYSNYMCIKSVSLVQ